MSPHFGQRDLFADLEPKLLQQPDEFVGIPDPLKRQDIFEETK
jgi:hypothetical protein